MTAAYVASQFNRKSRREIQRPASSAYRNPASFQRLTPAIPASREPLLCPSLLRSMLVQLIESCDRLRYRDFAKAFHTIWSDARNLTEISAIKNAVSTVQFHYSLQAKRLANSLNLFVATFAPTPENGLPRQAVTHCSKGRDWFAYPLPIFCSHTVAQGQISVKIITGNVLPLARYQEVQDASERAAKRQPVI